MRVLLSFILSFLFLGGIAQTSPNIQAKRVMVTGNLRPPLDTTGTPYYYGEIRSRLQDTALYMGIAVTGRKWIKVGTTTSGGGSGTVTEIAPGWGITALPDPITTTGFIGADSGLVTSRAWHQKGLDSLGLLITSSDTANLIFDTLGTGISAVLARNDTLFNKAFKRSPSIIWSTDTDSSMLANVDTTHGSASASITWGNFYRIINDSLTFGGGSYTFDWGLTEAATVVNVDSFEVASFLRLKKVADSLGALAGSTTIYNGNGSLNIERLIDQADNPFEISNLGSNGIATKFRLIPWKVDTGSRAEIHVRGDTTLDVFTRITATAQSTEAMFSVETGYSTTVSSELEVTSFSGDPRFQVHLKGGDPGVYFNYGHIDNPDSNKLVIPFTASTTDTVMYYEPITGQVQRRLVSSGGGGCATCWTYDAVTNTGADGILGTQGNFDVHIYTNNTKRAEYTNDGKYFWNASSDPSGYPVYFNDTVRLKAIRIDQGSPINTFSGLIDFGIATADASASNFAIHTQNSSLVRTFAISNSGVMSGIFGTLQTGLWTIGGATATIRSTNIASTTGNLFLIQPPTTSTFTTGAANAVATIGSYTVSSGTGQYNGLTVSNTINQSGTATGTTRSLFIQPNFNTAVPYEHHHLEISETGTNWPMYAIQQDSVATTNATPTTLHTFRTASNSVYIITAYVVAARTGGSSGTAGDVGTYIYEGFFKNIGGTVTMLSESIRSSYEDQAGWNVTTNISGTNIQLQVTGATDNNVKWSLVKGEIHRQTNVAY